MSSNWWTQVGNSWTSIWDKVANFLPNLVGAFLILIIGWIVAILVEKLLDRLFRALQLPTLFAMAKVEDLIKKSSTKLDTTGLLAATVKWILFLVAFIAAVNVLNLPTITLFLESILAYVPNVIAAVGILLIGTVLAHFLSNVISSTVKIGDIAFAQALSTIARYSIIIFAFVAALYQLNVAPAFLQTLVIGIVAFIAIAGGIAFGLGGQGVARDFLEKLRKDLQE
ncbi:MAG: hypothetical protein COX39_00540 [Candidatus Nealsonbacteria bacterium CG23_combo_of_CG06-09_8_20_14_all_40_13]|uniref:Small-conductance mechanosensitive ion channel n=1 Tax=Candidatus Nealsonbacteria bacterium CG23_combo_of_CG06-09_8_20_14_all_40_13 TaxID=1974724 RepID=A0A2G9YRL8_9BACT|nr:MAG: hypothetical protein COX39_00540 [Candidatus Nealsonbacteria bacterium CG23_combo_of_CG06-09_8_20_14_all_40_13]